MLLAFNVRRNVLSPMWLGQSGFTGRSSIEVSAGELEISVLVFVPLTRDPTITTHHTLCSQTEWSSADYKTPS